MDTKIPQRSPYRGHAHFWERAMARRRFIQAAAAGSTAAALGAGGWIPALADDDDGPGAAPRPIPIGQQFFGPGTEVFHVFLGKDQENVTITDFDGVMAAAHILGTATQIQGGVTTTGLLVDHDLRFMRGKYVGVDGRVHRGTFGFFWFDTYKDQVGPNENEITSIDPGNVPGGVFWTVRIPDDSVQVNPETGVATYRLKKLHTLDFHDFVNDALHHGESTPAIVSFTVRWGGTITGRETIRDAAKGFAGEFLYNSATVEWSAVEPQRPAKWGGPATYIGGPAGTSKSEFAVVGRERNGVYFASGGEDD